MGFAASRYARPAPVFGSSMYFDRPDVYNRLDYDYYRPYGSSFMTPYSSGLPSYYSGLGAPSILPTPMAPVSPMASTVPFAPMATPLPSTSGLASYGGNFGPGLSPYASGLASYQCPPPSGCCPPIPGSGSCYPCPTNMTCQQGVLKIPCVCMVPQPPPQQVPVPQPYPVIQQVPVPQPYPVVQTQQVPVPTPVYVRGPSVPVPVPQPVQVPVYIRSPPVCIPVPTPVPTPVPCPIPCPCPVPVCPPPVYPPMPQPCPPPPSNLCCHPYTPASAYACC